MNTRIATHHFFNPETQRALLEQGDGYVGKEEGLRDRLSFIRHEYKPGHIALLHLGENPEGCAPAVEDWLRDLLQGDRLRGYLGHYPESQSSELRVKLAVLHGIHPDWITVSAGLDQMIDMIAASFTEQRDKVLVTNPGFFLFEEYASRHGGVPVALQLAEADGFAWTDHTLEAFGTIVSTLDFKLIWLANPNNPTGRLMDPDLLEEVIRIARERWITIVVDEAYGEYTDPAFGVRSASRLLNQYDNLIVLRTFSKAWGLAGMRIGVAMTRNPDILAALRVHRQYFPVTRLSLELACQSLDNVMYLDRVRRLAAERRATLAKRLATVPGINLIDSDSGIAMVRCLGVTAHDLMAGLERQGVIVAPVSGTGVAAGQYVRLTLGSEEDLSCLARGLIAVQASHQIW